MTDQEELEMIELLEHGECIRLLGVGNSMRPLLRNGLDYAYIEHKSKHQLRKGDVILYKRDNKLILHRIVKIHESSYDLLGDGNVEIEKEIPEADVIGKAIGFERKDYYFPVKVFKYRVYWHIWVFLRPFRPLIKRINIRLKIAFGTYEDEDRLKEQKEDKNEI